MSSLAVNNVVVFRLTQQPYSPKQGLLEFSGSHQIPKVTWKG